MLSIVCAFAVTWMLAVTAGVYADRPAAVRALAWLLRHDVFWATVLAVVSGALAARRRALTELAAPDSWTVALPVARPVAKWQSIFNASTPALTLVGALAVCFGPLTVLALAGAGIPAPLMAWAAATGGVLVGDGVGYLLPSAKEEVHEGSRYIPHRHRSETPVPAGSLSALGVWPVRQMFANARPKTMSRAVFLILLCVPLGSSAADALLAIGLAAAICALILLVVASITVSAKASRWLRPLPVGSDLLLRITSTRALAFMMCASAIESWLIWVLGYSGARAVATGACIFAGGAVIAVTGSLVAIHGHKKEDSA